MAKKYVYIGTFGPIIYTAGALMPNEGVGGQEVIGLRTDDVAALQQVELTDPATEATHALRYGDFATLISEYVKAGEANLPIGATGIQVTLDEPFATADYSIFWTLSNSDDVSPSAYGGLVTAQDEEKFTLMFTAAMDTANYRVQWTAIKR